MLNQVSWTTYFELVLLLAAVYYLFVLFRYYGNDLRQLVHGGKPQTAERRIPEALRYEEPIQVDYPPAENHIEHHTEIFEQDAEVGSLIIQVKQCIQTAADKPFAPAVLIPQVKKLFRDYPHLQHSRHREAINETVVQECEKTGTALLTEDEVDQWWSD